MVESVAGAPALQTPSDDEEDGDGDGDGFEDGTRWTGRKGPIAGRFRRRRVGLISVDERFAARPRGAGRGSSRRETDALSAASSKLVGDRKKLAALGAQARVSC